MNPASVHKWCAAGFLPGLLLLAGCSSFRTEFGRPLPSEGSQFVEGQTRVGEVLREFGPPHQASALPQGFAFLYEYSKMGEFQFGISVNLPIVRWFKLVHAWNQLDERVLLLTFDDEGVLRGRGSGGWEEDLGGGNAVQILFVVMSLSDISNIRRPVAAHEWGKTLLQKPPETLNSGQSLRTGANGVEQRLAPIYAGQQTLEMAKPKTEKQKRKIKKSYQQQQPR